MKLGIAVFGAFVVLGLSPPVAAVTYFGTTPYAKRSDSPFAQAIAVGDLRVDAFEDGFLNSSFVTTICGPITNAGRPSGFRG